MQPEFQIDPETVRAAAGLVAGSCSVASTLAARATSLSSEPMRQHFPVVPEGQQAAQTWDEARTIIAAGLTQVHRALDKLSNGLQQAATQYVSADEISAAQVTRAHTPVHLDL